MKLFPQRERKAIYMGISNLEDADGIAILKM
jgi:hypothetical protein